MEEINRIEKWYETKVTFVIACCTPLVVVMSFIFGIKENVAVIQSNITNINLNHEVHIQDLQQNYKDLKKQQGIDEAQMIDLQKQIISIISKR